MKSGSAFPFFYGWVIVAATAVLLALVYAAWYSFPVFLVAIPEELGWSRAITAGAFSVFSVVHGASGPVTGILVDRRGPRLVVGLGGVLLVAGLIGSSLASQPWHFYLAFGVVVAAGVGAAGWVPAMTLLQSWFVRRLGTVVGITAAGTGLGTVLFVPLAQYSISLFGWRNTYLLIAAASFVVILPIAGLFLRRPEDMGLQPDGAAPIVPGRRREPDPLAIDPVWAGRTWTLRTALATHRFWFAVASVVFLGFATQMALAHQVALLTDAGYAKLVAASAAGAVGVAGIVGKLLWGAASDRWGREWAFSAGMACQMVAFGFLALAPASPAPWLPYAYAVWMGLGYAVWALITASLAADLFRGPSYGSIFGVMNMSTNFGVAAGVFLAGYIYDLTGGYFPALAVGLVAILGSAISLWLAGPRHVRLVPGRAARLARRLKMAGSSK